MNAHPTEEQLKTWARDNRELALAVAKTQAFAQLERERVNAYVLPIFMSYGFTDEDGKPITKPERLYLSDAEDRIALYYDECDLAHSAHGYTGEYGTCPALVAESLQIKAENALLQSLATFIGVDGFYASLDLRKKALRIAMQTALHCDDLEPVALGT